MRGNRSFQPSAPVLETALLLDKEDKIGRPITGLRYGVGGPAGLLYRCGKLHDLERLSDAVRSTGAPVVVLGMGSNVLVADRGLDAVVVRLSPRTRWWPEGDGIVKVSGGSSCEKFTMSLAEAGWTNFPWLHSVPGTVGGAVRMNAGVEHKQREIENFLVDAVVFDLDTGEGATWLPGDFGFGFRCSKLTDRQIVISARFRCTAVEPPAAMAAAEDHRNDRLAKKQPGWDDEGDTTTKRTTGSVIAVERCGEDLDRLGAKEKRVGRARVAADHANFIVVDPGPGGRAEHVLELTHELAALYKTEKPSAPIETRLYGFTPAEIAGLELHT